MSDTERLQLALHLEALREKRPDFDPGAIDGIRGPKTRAALLAWSIWAHSQLQGFDASAFQPHIDWPGVAAAGVRFVALRTSASMTRDVFFTRHWRAAKAARLLRFRYHFCAPWRPAKPQVALALQEEPSDLGEGPLIADIEALAPKQKPGQPPPTPVTTAQLVAWSQEFLAEAKRLTGRDPIFYTYSAFAREHQLAKFFKQYLLWLADYREGPPTAPQDWPYVFHQYAGDTGRQVGVEGPCDLDRFKGSEAELLALFRK